MRKVTILDYGLGNILSVVRAAEKINCSVLVARSSNELTHNGPIIIPGVGAFPEAMRRIDKLGLRDKLTCAAELGIPILGICLGMQLLFARGEEHVESTGLNLIPGSVVQLPSQSSAGERLRIPSVGWRQVFYIDRSPTSALPQTREFVDGHSFYFVHSYHVIPTYSNHLVASYRRGEKNVAAIVNRDNVWGVQFHPEKSGRTGLMFLDFFIRS